MGDQDDERTDNKDAAVLYEDDKLHLELKKAQEHFLETSNRLYQSGIDFVKWTTTIALASFLVIATRIGAASQSSLKMFYIVPIIFLSYLSELIILISICFAIFAVYFALNFWAMSMNLSKELVLVCQSSIEEERKFYKLPKPLYFLANCLIIERKMLPFRDSYKFNQIILIHIISLISGLVIYSIVIILQSTF